MVERVILNRDGCPAAVLHGQTGVRQGDLVRLAQMFVRQHGEGASRPDGEDGAQNGFRIGYYRNAVTIEGAGGDWISLQHHLQEAFRGIAQYR